MKNKTTKKLAGGFMIAVLFAVIGAVFVTADTGKDADDMNPWHMPFGGRGCNVGRIGMDPKLTEEQQAEIDELIADLTEEGATEEEIREAISQKLDEMGILDERLDTAIEHTEQRLEILNRQKELSDQGYSWEEINEIISEEFDIEFPIGFGGGMKHGRGCRHGHRFGWNKPSISEDSDSSIVESSTI